MGLYDDLLIDELPKQKITTKQSEVQTTQAGGLYDDLLIEEQPQEQTFAEKHPFVASIHETGKQFGTRAVKSYPEFAKGLNDLVALVGDKTGLQGISDFGRNNAEFWKNQSDKTQIDPKYQGFKGLSDKSTILPTIAGSLGDQTTNILTALGGGAAGAVASKVLGLGKIGTGIATFTGTSLPNLAQEGSYLDKIQQFKEIYGRIPTYEELRQIQNVALGEKAINTALETVSDRLLFGKLFPQGTITKNVKGIITNAEKQALTEAATEGMQEGVSIGAENMLGINQGNNLERIADSIAIGGVTGGILGGGSTLVSQPVDTQFQDVNTSDVIKNVSAKILDKGKVLYDSAKDNLNNTLNSPDSFDNLRKLSKNGTMSGKKSLEELAPNIAQKQEEKKAKLQEEKIKNFETNLEKLINTKDNSAKIDIGEVSEKVLQTGMEVNINLSGYRHNIDKSSLNHILNRHGKKENYRKQIPVTNEDIKKIPNIIYNADSVEYTGKNNIGKDTFRYTKVMPDGTIYYIEEVRTGKKTLTANTLYKKSERSNVKKPKSLTSETTLTNNIITDNVNAFNPNETKNIINNSSDTSVKDTELPNFIKEKETLKDLTQDGERQIVDNDTVNETAKQIKKTEKKAKANQAALGRPQQQTKADKKEAAKIQAIEKIKELAPNIAAKKEEKTNAQKSADLAKLQREVGVGGLIKDNEGNVYEVLDNGYIRNVDTNEHSAGSIDREYQKYEHNEKELISATPFKYNPKSKDNADNYTFSKQEAVDAHNNYIKNPTEANREIYEDTIGRLQNEYYKLEPQFKAELQQTKNKVSDSVKEIAPNIAAKVDVKKKVLEQVINDKFRKINDEHTARMAQVYNKYTQQDIIAGKADAEIEAINKEFEPLEKEALSSTAIEKVAPNIAAKQTKKAERKNKKSRKKISQEETSNNKKFDISIIEKLKNHTATLEESNAAALYYLKLRNHPDSVEAANNLLKLLDENRIYNENNRAKNNGGTLNGHSIEETNGDRSAAPEKQETGRTETKRVPQEKSANGSNTAEVGRGNDISNEGQREISQKDKEIIEKNYKNQHELNKAIEDYINNEEYKKYPGSVRMPQAIKDWLKKYTGAGGLEKQGAEGKGLLTEYYTPQNIVNKMWQLTAQYVNTNGAKVLEPSGGIGRFLENAPENTSFDVIEINPVSAMITKILYPNSNVTTGEFQEKFIDKTNNKPVKNVTPEYDIVIGNPPYGQYSGRYKGLGEGKKYTRLEAYFINRCLDSLKENGIMTFIVPSSFLDGAITIGKQEIGSKCVLLDAYRLPENTFNTTSIGTDIIILRKTALKSYDRNLNLGNWFKAYPEKVLGTIEERKNRFGKMENYVKGDKNAVDTIFAAKKDIKETVVAKSATTEKPTTQKSNQVTRKTNKKPAAKVKGKVEYTEYQHENVANEREMELWEHTTVDGSLSGNYKVGEDINQYNGKLYNDFNYLQGNIYEKLDELKYENISEEQREIQKKKLLSVLPEAKKVEQISFNPTSDFIREYSLGDLEEEVYNYTIRNYKKVKTPDTLDKRYKKYIEHLTNSERNGVSTWDIRKFIDGDKIRIDYHYSSYSLTDAEKKAERSRQQAEYMTKLKNTVDKTFNDFVKSELTKEEKEALSDAWNRKFNNTYNPDFKSMPMIVKGLNSEFNGNKLALQNVQVEGVNFLTNKGVGLLGFEVGVGKTLTGIISTVQNMQIGRCKKPLILVPKQVKDNWIREINQAFPNIEVNDVDNMSKFKGEIKEKTLTVATYEALGNIWYGENSANDLINQIYEVSNDFNRDSTKRGKEKTKERAAELVGKAEGGNKKLFNIQDIGFDHITVDEAHNFKNLFADAKADGQEGNTYVNISGGSTSTRAARLFLLTQYILNNNGNRNVFMLTATPFNNSPLEVFNMLSYLAKNELDNKGLYNVYQFMENYADISSDWIVNSRNEVEYKQVVTGFKNASSLRELIKSVMLIRSAEDAGIVRPEKYTKRVTLEPSQAQIELIAQAEEDAVNGKKDEGAVLKAINQSRKATLSPDIATDNFDVSSEDFIKNSPKLNYVVKAVESMKKKDNKTSQLIYMPLGVKFLPKIKQYLVNKGVFKEDEIEIIDSSVNDDKIVKITDSFNERNGTVKLVIGTNKIKEGMNLNKNSSVLYVPYMDWNPTDFVQVVGRIWRRGNRYKKIRVVVPLLKNSSDSFMFQKLNEKTDRINNIMDESKEYIDTSELNTAEEKINMISNPEKKMRMFIQVEKQKLNSKLKDLQGRLETSQSYLNNLKSNERMLKTSEERYADTVDAIKKIDLERDKWNYEYTERRLNEYKKDVNTYKISLKKIQERIARLELDFEGKDSPEAINSEIEKVNKDIKEVEEYGKKKLVEFTEEYEKERLNSKTIDDLIKEFENDTINLYGDLKFEDSKPLATEPQKKYEKTREAAYSVPVIKLETKSQKDKKSKTKKRIEKAKQIVDARKYNKVLKEGVQKWSAEIGIRRYEVDRTLNNFINITRQISKKLKVNDKNLREIMPFLRERTELPEKLNRPELTKVWETVHNTKGMPERLTQLADTLSDKFEKFWEEYISIQASGEYTGDENKIKNYINHEWDMEDKQTRNLLTNYFATKSKHGKQRSIKTYYQGINGIELENGEIKQFKPKTLDYAELVKMQTDSLIKATCDKVFADSVKSFKTTEGANLVLPSSQAPSNWVEINHSALNKTVARPVKTTFGEKIAPDLQNILAKIGIAIGNRIPSRKGNGKPNSLGRFVKNEPPEIRLQRWFSNKTLAHEVGHALDNALKLQEDGFVNRHKQELIELNRERIEAFAKQGDRSYAEKDSELIAELFGVLFNDIDTAYKIAPAATNEVIEKMTKNNMENLLPPNFDWAEAKHILEEKVVEFFKIPVRVHPDIAATLQTVFEPQKEYLDILGFKPGKVIDEQTAIMKMMEFSISGFHNIALTESYLGNVGVRGLKEALDFKKIFNSLKNNEYDVYKKDKVALQAIKDGLQIGTPLDIDRGAVETVINNIGNWAEKHIPIIGKPFSLTTKITEKGIELNNKVLWDVIHNNYKLTTYELLIKQESKNGDLTVSKRREIASWVNDSFGGLAMENLGITPNTKKMMSRWLMSPDWLIATTRQFMGIFGNETGHSKINKLSESSEKWQKIKDITETLGIFSLTGDVTASGMRGRIARAFWIRSLVLSALYMNILNALFRMWDKKEYPELYPEKLSARDYSMLGNSTDAKLYVFIGRNKDGTERYLRLGKQFREIPEMAADPIKHFGNKLSPVFQTGIVSLTGHSTGGFEDKEISNSKGWNRVALVGKNLTGKYIPLSVQNAFQKIVKKQGTDFTPFDLIGNTSKGMSKYKAKEQFQEAFKRGNNPNKIREIERSMARNSFSQKEIKSIEQGAKTSYTKQFKDSYKEALQQGDIAKVQKITNIMTKNNISQIDQKKIYTKALSEVYKEKGIK